MRSSGEPSGRAGGLGRRGLAAAAVGLMLVAVTACGDDDEGGGGSASPDEVGAEEAADLLGPEEPASGEPVRIGMVSDGATDAFDNRDELRAAEATAEFWNTHRGGVGGRPIEVVTCESRNDPGTAADCANRFVEEDVVAVGLSQSGVTESLWEPLHAAGVPTFFFQAGGDAVASDPETSFVMFNPLATFYSLPTSIAEDEETNTIAFVVIDVPQALSTFETDGPRILENAGLDYELIAIPPGTADMTSQMQEVANSDAGVVQVIGNDAFCIAAFNGLTAVGYEGEITSITQCITDATREAVPGDVLEGISVISTIALGAEDDETFQLYEAVMSTFGQEVEDVNNATAMGAYATMGGLLSSLEGIEGDVTAETVVETIRAMPEAQELPGGGGLTFQCGGSASEEMPAVCTNQSLRAVLDAEGNPASYEVADASEALG